VSYQNDRVKTGPWSIHIVKMDRNEPSLELHSILATTQVLGLSTTSEQAMSVPASWGTVLAAVNGDFYKREDSSYAGDPRGLQIVEGEVVSAPTEGSVFWIDAAGEPHATNVISAFKVTWPDGTIWPIGLNEERLRGGAVLYTPTLGKTTRNHGRGLEMVLEQSGDGPWLPLQIGETYTAKVRQAKEGGNTSLTPGTMVLSVDGLLASNVSNPSIGAVLKISMETVPSLKGARTAIGGGPVVTRQGKAMEIERPSNGLAGFDYTLRSRFERHPRSVMGWNDTHYFLGEVDGRQRGLSVGMTLKELGSYMAKIGCDTAMSLDGGGSATFWYRGRVVNNPCDGTERPVANSLAVVRKPKPEAKPGSPAPSAANLRQN
jgi:hypothetical protein